jgi:hypothetical protein
VKQLHDIQHIEFEKGKLILKIDGKEFIFQLAKILKKLNNASDVERCKYEMSVSGYGIHWPLIDENLSIDGLLGIKHTTSYFKKDRTASL